MVIKMLFLLGVFSICSFALGSPIETGNYGTDKLECGFKVTKNNERQVFLKLINNPLNGVYCNIKDLGSLIDLGAFGDKELNCDINECQSETFKYVYYIGSNPLSYELRYKISSLYNQSQFVLMVERQTCKNGECTFKSIANYHFQLMHKQETVPAHKFVFWSRLKDNDAALDVALAKALKACANYGYSDCKEEITELINISGWSGPIARSIVNGKQYNHGIDRLFTSH